jgi:hypothetical protein
LNRCNIFFLPFFEWFSKAFFFSLKGNLHQYGQVRPDPIEIIFIQSAATSEIPPGAHSNEELPAPPISNEERGM